MVLLASVLRVAGSSLRHLPNTLAAELLGRLRPYAKSNDLIASLANQCHSAGLRHCSLLPAFQCFDAPIEALLFALEGHSNHITDIAFNSDGSQLFSVSEDGKLMSWDMKTGEYLFCRDVSDSKVSKYSEIRITESGRLVLENYTESSPLKVFTATTGMFLHDVTERKHGFIHNTVVTRNFALREGELADVRNGQIKIKIDRLCQMQNFVTVAVTHNEKYLLLGHSDETEMLELLTGKLVKKFPNRTSPSKTDIIRPSQMVITNDDQTLITGFSVDCLVTAINIDPSSSQFGQVSFEFDYQRGFPDQQFIESSQYSQEVRELYISPDQKLVLANVKRCHLFVIDLATGNTKMLNTDVFEGSGMIFHESRFLQDSKSVAAIYGNNLCMWTVEGHLVSHLRLLGCEDDHYLLASCPAQNVVATVSSQEKSVKVYDLDKLKETEVPSVHVYNNPVDCIAVSSQKKLAFVKTYRRLNTHRGYHFTEYFGIDVWNLATNNWQHYLPWGKYGQLIQIQVSLDGQYLILVTQNKMVSTVFVIDIVSSEIKKKLNLKDCTHAVLSPDSEHLLVECKAENNTKEVHLWDINESTAGKTFHNASNPLFSFDSKRVVCISENKIMSYCTVTQKHDFLLLKKIIPYEIKAIPNRPHTVTLSGLTTGGTLMKKGVKLELWNLMSKNRSAKIDGVSPVGIVDTSKDGHIGVDSYLQVIDFVSGKIILQCDKQAALSAQEKPLVRLTYDGQYVIWADTKPAECVKAMRVQDGQLVAEVSTHSKVVSLNVADFGYLVVVGTNDGHLLMFRLHRRTVQEDDEDERISLSGTLDRRNIAQVSPMANGTLHKSRKKLSEGNLFSLIGNGNNSPDNTRRKSAGSLSLYSISSVSASGYSTLPKSIGSQMNRSNSSQQLNEEISGIHPVDLQRLDLLFQEEEDELADENLPVASGDVASQLEEGAWFSHGGNYDYQTSVEKHKSKRSSACIIV